METTESQQTVFWIAAGVFLLFHVFHGWRQGPARMVASLVILGLAWVGGWFGSEAMVPLLRPLVPLPDLLLRVAGGLVVALGVFFLLSLLSSLTLRKTDDQESGLARLVYGVTGAGLGAVIGLGILWVALLGLRLAGSVAESRIEMAREAGTDAVGEASETSGVPRFARSLAGLRASVDTGPLAGVLDRVDVIPESVYETMDDLTRVLNSAASLDRFMSYPGVDEIARHPRMIELVHNPEVAEAARERRFLDVMRHPAVIEAANDPALAELIRGFDLPAALRHARGEPAPAAEAGGAAVRVP